MMVARVPPVPSVPQGRFADPDAVNTYHPQETGKRCDQLICLMPWLEYVNVHKINTAVRIRWLWKFLGLDDSTISVHQRHVWINWLFSNWTHPNFHAFMTATEAEKKIRVEKGLVLVRLSSTVTGMITVSYWTSEDSLCHARVHVEHSVDAIAKVFGEKQVPY